MRSLPAFMRCSKTLISQSQRFLRLICNSRWAESPCPAIYHVVRGFFIDEQYLALVTTRKCCNQDKKECKEQKYESKPGVAPVRLEMSQPVIQKLVS
jgi:hypothetical protein